MALSDNVIRDGDQGFLGFASRLNPLTLPAGMLQESVNMRLDRGVAQKRKGSKRLTDTVGTTGAPLTLDFPLGVDQGVISITFVAGPPVVATATVTAHGYSNGDLINIGGATGLDAPFYNGDFTISNVTTDTFDYTMTGAPANAATGTLLANEGPIVRSTYEGGLYAAGVFASQNYENANEYIVLVGNDQAYLWRDDVSIDTIGYPSSPDELVEATDTVSVVQAFDRLYILREAERTPNTEWANRLLGADAGTFTVTIASPGVVTKTAHGLENTMAVTLATTSTLPTGLTAGTVYYVVAKTDNTFQLSATSGGAAINTTGSQSGVHTLTPVSAVVSSTTATIFCKDHPYLAAQRVRLEGGGPAAFNGHEFDVLDGANAPTTHTFQITVPSGTANDTASSAARVTRRVKPPIYWTGSGSFVRAVGGVPTSGPTFKTMPSVGWANYINNRLVIPAGRDSVLISDVLDADVYDPFWQSFQVGAGGSDRIVAVHPWVDGSILIFCRSSIWLATINQQFVAGGTDTLVASISLLTDEIGCSARNTISTAGQYVFFLSDAGIYRLDARLDLKLRGDTRPLSEPVANLFADVVQSRVEDSAFAVWHDNRYIIALPVSADPLAGNELVLCWNALNEQWEYKDEYPESSSVNEIMVSLYDNKRRVFAIPRAGNLYLLEENESGEDDQSDGTVTNYMPASITTRRLNFGEMSSKRFLRSVTDVIIPAGGGITTTVNVYDPDKSEQIGTITNDTGGLEDYHLKAPIRFKAHGAELVLTTTAQRPQIRSVAIEASPKSEPATLTRNES
jgi:hypothetical protein